MINPKTGATLLFAMLSLGGMVAIPGLSLVPTTTAYAQTSLAEDIVGGVLDDFFGDDEEETADNTQTVEQPVTQDTNQDVDQSETNDQSNTNTQTQVGAIGQDIEQGTQDGDDSAKSSSESGDAKKGSSSSSSSGDSASINNGDAANGANLQQLQVQNVDQNNFAEFGDDSADLDNVNLAVPIAVPINVDENQEEIQNGEEDTITVCVEGEFTDEVTLEELQQLLDEGLSVELGPCEIE